MVLHIRIFSPAEVTDRVLALLEHDPEVSALSVHRGDSLIPKGDVVTADVAREGANAIIDALRDMGLHRTGTIHIEAVDTWLSQGGFAAERAAPGASADAVVWAEVGSRAYADTELNWTYITFMALATLLAGIAIVLDAPILVVGAMVLGPEFGPIAAIGLALVRRRGELLRRALRTLVLGFVVAIGFTFLVGMVLRMLGWVSIADLTAERPGTAFIYTPDKWSFLVAVIAAAAGVLSLTSARLGGISGVFISVTTVPAAGNVGLGLAFGAWDEVEGSLLQLALNLSGMMIAGWLTLVVQQAVWSRTYELQRRRHAERAQGDGRAPWLRRPAP